MTLLEAISELYDKEISAGLQAEFNVGITVWIGSDCTGQRLSANFGIDKFDQAAQWLHEEARRLYPELRE